jgi:hypothetical protein
MWSNSNCPKLGTKCPDVVQCEIFPDDCPHRSFVPASELLKVCEVAQLKYPAISSLIPSQLSLPVKFSTDVEDFPDCAFIYHVFDRE